MQGNPGARTAMQYAIDLVTVPSIIQAHIHQGEEGMLYIGSLSHGAAWRVSMKRTDSPPAVQCRGRRPLVLAGMNGPICVFLYGPVTSPSPEPFTGHFGQGVITEARCSASLAAAIMACAMSASVTHC